MTPRWSATSSHHPYLPPRWRPRSGALRLAVFKASFPASIIRIGRPPAWMDGCKGPALTPQNCHPKNSRSWGLKRAGWDGTWKPWWNFINLARRFVGEAKMMVIARCCWFQHDFHKEPAWSAGSAWSFTTSIGSSRDTWCQTRSSAHQDDQSMSKLQKHRNYTIIVLPTPFKMDDSGQILGLSENTPNS